VAPPAQFEEHFSRDPGNTLPVITGLSGSVVVARFRTIYAEGQRPLCRSTFAYARPFLDQMERPDVDSMTA